MGRPGTLSVRQLFVVATDPTGEPISRPTKTLGTPSLGVGPRAGRPARIQSVAPRGEFAEVPPTERELPVVDLLEITLLEDPSRGGTPLSITVSSVARQFSSLAGIIAPVVDGIGAAE